MTPTVITPEFQLPYQAGTDQDNPNVIALPDGRFFVVWVDDNGDNEFITADGEDIVGQFFGADGTPDGDPFQVNVTFEDGDQVDPVALASPNSAVAVLFEDEEPVEDQIIFTLILDDAVDSSSPIIVGNTPQIDPTATGGLNVVFDRDNDVFLFLFNFDELGDPIEVPVITGFTDVIETSLAVLGDDTVVVAATVDDALGNANVVFQRYDPAAEAPVGSLITVDEGNDQYEDLKIISLATGGFVVTYTEVEGVTSSTVKIVIFGSNGTVLETITPDVGDNTEDSTLVPLANGDFIAFWNNATEETAYGQRFDPTGDPVGDQFVAGDTEPVSDMTAAVSTDGNLFVVYEAVGGSDGMFGTVFDIDGVAGSGVAPGEPLDPSAIWKPEFQLPKTDGADQDVPAVAAIGHGRFLVAWTDDGDATDPLFDRDGNDVAGQIFDARGNPVGDAFQINVPTVDGGATDVAVAGRVGGGFVAVYETFDGADQFVRIATFDIDGNEIGGLPTVVAEDADTPAIVGATDGRFLVTYRESAGDAVKAKIVATDGSIGDEIIVNADAHGPSAAALVDGSFAVAVTSDDDIVVHTVSAAGIVSAPIQVTDDALDQSGAAIAALAGGGFVVAFNERYADGNGDVLFAVYDAAGDVVQGPTSVDGNFIGEDNEAAVTALPDGGFVVLWDNDIAETAEGQRYDADGNAVGGIFVANAFGLPGDPIIATLEDGRVFTGAADRSGTDGLFGAIYDFRDGTVIKGTDGKDVLTSAVDGAVVKGKDGKDILIGVGARDELFGGKGKDILIGEGGDDRLKGGKKADQFVFTAELDARTNVDGIKDFSRKQGDTIVLLDDIFDAVGNKVGKGEFVVGNKAKDDNDHLILKLGENKNKLYYDVDGKGGDDMVMFAKLEAVLKYKDFAVIDELVL
ncbi:calcium-binding protein [Bauldia sp.]|uniref:calcium-binding protein n=1 Tax=Bauldia sp. TaxID=2575872 RepID=UPI003BAC70A5